MVFSSLLFVFLFFISNLIVQAFVPDMKKKNIVMLAFSMVFYAWGGPKYVVLLLGMTFICWAGALYISSWAKTKAQRKLGMTVTAVLVLAILGVFKYTGFFLSNLQLLTGFPEVVPAIALPIGISFYTFQLLSYVVDVYRDEVEVQRKYWLLLLYASLFHQCIAGPIVRYKDVNDDILYRKVKRGEVDRGITRFACGLAKKAVLANGCAAVADALLAGTVEGLAAVPALGVWLGGLAYMLQIYLDFSAYSDMAIGMGLMCGFHYKENFNYPYIADSITDFWRRWHISLSSFFRDYVYIPLGGNRCSAGRQIFNMFVVWGLTGMWHGASWNFIIWGLYFFVFLVIEKYFLKEFMAKCPKVLLHLAVLLVIYISWMIFRFTDMSMLGTALAGLFGLNGNGFTNLNVNLELQNNIFFLIFCCFAVTPLGTKLNNILNNAARMNKGALVVQSVWRVACPLLMLVLSMMALAGDSYNPFLYFRF